MIVHQSPDPEKNENYPWTYCNIMPIIDGWLVSFGQNVYKVTTKEVELKYQNNWLMHFEEKMEEKSYYLSPVGQLKHISLDEHGQKTKGKVIFPPSKTKLTTLRNLDIDLSVSNCLSDHFNSQDLLFIEKEEKTKILTFPKIKAAKTSRDENTILIITDQIIIIDNPC